MVFFWNGLRPRCRLFRGDVVPRLSAMFDLQAPERVVCLFDLRGRVPAFDTRGNWFVGFLVNSLFVDVAMCSRSEALSHLCWQPVGSVEDSRLGCLSTMCAQSCKSDQHFARRCNFFQAATSNNQDVPATWPAFLHRIFLHALCLLLFLYLHLLSSISLISSSAAISTPNSSNPEESTGTSNTTTQVFKAPQKPLQG